MLSPKPAQPFPSMKEQPGQRENRRAASALCDYLELGQGRSLDTLLAHYQHKEDSPTRRAPTLNAWAQRYDWRERAAEWDEVKYLQAQTVNADRTELAISSGLALSSERVESLKQLYADLQVFMCQAWPVWMADLQSVEPGISERSRSPRFNPAVIAQMRGILDDLARETGGRAARSVTALSARLENDPGDTQQLDYTLLSQQELDTLETILMKALPSTTRVQQSLPGFS